MFIELDQCFGIQNVFVLLMQSQILLVPFSWVKFHNLFDSNRCLIFVNHFAPFTHRFLHIAIPRVLFHLIFHKLHIFLNNLTIHLLDFYILSIIINNRNTLFQRTALNVDSKSFVIIHQRLEIQSSVYLIRNIGFTFVVVCLTVLWFVLFVTVSGIFACSARLR